MRTSPIGQDTHNTTEYFYHWGRSKETRPPPFHKTPARGQKVINLALYFWSNDDGHKIRIYANNSGGHTQHVQNAIIEPAPAPPPLRVSPPASQPVSHGQRIRGIRTNTHVISKCSIHPATHPRTLWQRPRERARAKETDTPIHLDRGHTFRTAASGGV